MRAELREHQERLRQLHARNNTGKRCGRCRGWLSFEAFRPDSRSANGWSSYCNDCAAAADREWRERHSGYVDAYNERRRLEYAEQQREARQRTCSECGEGFTGRPNRCTCSPECRRRRKARTDTRWPKASP